jgi:DNA-directed RNA polymerase sigma subunit (sigma70/sigma32)
VLATLDEREQRIIMSRAAGKMQAEVGRLEGISAARVAQIEQRALRKLCHPVRARMFAPWLTD